MTTSSPVTGATPPTQVEVADQLPVVAEVMVAACALLMKRKNETTASKKPTVEFLEIILINCGGKLELGKNRI